MKKLTRKLFLSVAALAVCAATLVSTTFAWYVSNSSANVGPVTGTTAGTDINGNLLVADATSTTGGYTPSSFVQNLTNISAKSAPTNGLIPVSKDTTTVKPATGDTGWHDVDNQPVDEEDAYGEFLFFVLSTKATSITMEVKIENKTQTTDIKKQTVLNTTGAPTSTSLNEEFFKDAVEALRVEIIQVDDETDDVYDTEDGTSLGVFAVEDLMTSYTKLAGAATGGNANSYYHAIMGKDPAGGNTEATTSDELDALTLTAGEASLIIVRYWLEGTDTDCFDSCIHQSFNFTITLSAE